MDNERPVTTIEFDAGLRNLENRLLDSMRQIETNLLTEFHRYAKGQNARVHNVEVGEYDMKLR